MKDLAIDSRVFLEDDLDCAIQELDLIMNTNPTELIGETDFGVELEPFLWTLTPTTTEIKRYIEDRILKYTYFCKKFNVTVNCTFMRGEYRSIYLVEITLKIKGEVIATKKYQFQ